MRRNRSKAAVAGLPPDMLANIHGRLSLLDRLAFTAALPASRGAFRPEAPWLVLPGDAPETTTLFSLSDRSAATLRAPELALRDHAVLGCSSSSSGGWLVTADDQARLCLVNPVTGQQRALPAITTIPGLMENWSGLSFLMLEQKGLPQRVAGGGWFPRVTASRTPSTTMASSTPLPTPAPWRRGSRAPMPAACSRARWSRQGCPMQTAIHCRAASIPRGGAGRAADGGARGLQGDHGRIPRSS